MRRGIAVLQKESPSLQGGEDVKKIVRHPDVISIPATVAPDPNAAALDHVLFALKHEGVNLQILAQALPTVPAEDLASTFEASPASKYLRTACYFWEQFTGRDLQVSIPAIGPYAPVFNINKYLVGTTVRDQKWRVDFNGLGPLALFCPTVERTASIVDLLEKDTLARAHEFAIGLDADLLDRTLSWAYLSETESSFAIEREHPTATKAQAFVSLLKHATNSKAIDEEYLVALQNLAVGLPTEHNFQFRTQQNWLRGGGGGVLAVTYVPPPPEDIPGLMKGIMDFMNNPPRGQNEIVVGAIASFGFVFAHPFMDGNGRLSRFLFQKALCQSEALSQGLVLPLSAAMKRNEAAYLAALKSFSTPARELWEISMIDTERFHLEFKGDASVYRFFTKKAPPAFVACAGSGWLRGSRISSRASAKWWTTHSRRPLSSCAGTRSTWRCETPTTTRATPRCSER